MGEVRAEQSPPFPVTHRGTPSPKRIPSGRGGRDRFTAESYTVLGKEGEVRRRVGNSGQGSDGGVWERTPSAGETSSHQQSFSGNGPSNVCLQCWGNEKVWGEPELMELRKKALDWGVAGQELEGGFPGVCQVVGTWE